MVQEEWNNFLLFLLVQVLVPAYLRCIPHIHIPKQKVKVTGHEYDKNILHVSMKMLKRNPLYCTNK